MGMSPLQEIDAILTRMELMMDLAHAAKRDDVTSPFEQDIRRAKQLSKLLLDHDPERDEDD